MGSQQEAHHKQNLHWYFGHVINLMIPKWKYLDQFDNCFLVPVDDKHVLYVTLFIFSDCIILGWPDESGYEYVASTIFDEKSYAYVKHDLKYY